MRSPWQQGQATSGDRVCALCVRRQYHDCAPRPALRTMLSSVGWTPQFDADGWGLRQCGSAFRSAHTLVCSQYPRSPHPGTVFDTPAADLWLPSYSLDCCSEDAPPSGFEKADLEDGGRVPACTDGAPAQAASTIAAASRTQGAGRRRFGQGPQSSRKSDFSRLSDAPHMYLREIRSNSQEVFARPVERGRR